MSQTTQSITFTEDVIKDSIIPNYVEKENSNVKLTMRILLHQKNATLVVSEFFYPSDECIVCGKGVKWIVRKCKEVCERNKLVKCVTKTAEDSIKQSAMLMDDENMLRKIAGEDLVAKEAHYYI